MSNPFLNKSDLMDRDVETAILLEKAIIHDIGNAVAYTDGNKMYINTDDNLFNILPAYDHRMLKWLLWHEKMHLELRHHNRFFRYLSELSEEDTLKEFQVDKNEVNIIMDILVHDSLSKMFPELVEVALNNVAQFRNRNSLSYTFKTYTLEEMLDEYKAHKRGDEGKGMDSKDEGEGESEGIGDIKSKDTKTEDSKDPKSHSEAHKKDKDTTSTAEEGEPEIKGDGEKPDESEPYLPDEHDKTDWSQLKNIDDKEFITEVESEAIQDSIDELKRKKFKLAKLTETLNGLVTSARRRTYSKPCSIKLPGNAILKGSTPGRTLLYLIFDASGSMNSQMNTFKEIISKSIPQAMETPCEWFAGSQYHTPIGKQIEPYKVDISDGYYKAQFKDFMTVSANNGYNDDGDRTIELCLKAEQLGYSPIGVTDGGGQLDWSIPMLKQLKRTVLVGQNKHWLDRVKEINPSVQTLDI